MRVGSPAFPRFSINTLPRRVLDEFWRRETKWEVNAVAAYASSSTHDGERWWWKNTRLAWPGILFVTEIARDDSRNEPSIEIHGEPAELVTIRVPLLRPTAAVLPWRVEAYLAEPKNDSMRLVSRCEVDRDEGFAELRAPTRELVVAVRSNDAFGVVASGHVAKDSSLTTGGLELREAPTPWVAGSFLCVDPERELQQSGWLKIETNGIPPNHVRIEGVVRRSISNPAIIGSRRGSIEIPT